MGFSILPQGDTALGLIGRSLGSGLGEGISGQLTRMLEDKKLTAEQNKYEKLGYPKDLARLAASATTGGKTEVVKLLLDQMQRGGFNQESQQTREIQESALPQEEKGLTTKEKIKRESERFKPQLELYNENNAKLKSLDTDALEIERLEKLNESGKLPKGLQLWNVNSEGGLRFPFLANSQTQAFVKTVNDFTTHAKESFGGRVTNFELGRFMTRLPTLMNSEEGRRDILQQMNLLNEINRTYSRELKSVVNESGGVRKVDWDRAEALAEKRAEKKTEKLAQKYISIDQRLDSIAQKEKLVPGTIRLYKNGKPYNIPQERVQDALKQGFKQQ